MSVALRLHGVGHAYGERPVLADVDLALSPGRLVVVVGPNGAGKSTLLRIAAGRLAPAQGRATLDGADLHRLPRRRLARVVGGILGRVPAASPLRVRDAVALGRHPWRGAFAPEGPDDVAHVDEGLACLDLTDLAHRPLSTLSSGERARCALARVVAQDAPLWILDEPTAHLDLGHALAVMALLRRRAAAGRQGILCVVHDLNLALGLAEEVLLLDGGQVVARGEPDQVLTAARVATHFQAPVRAVADGRAFLLAPARAEDPTAPAEGGA